MLCIYTYVLCELRIGFKDPGAPGQRKGAGSVRKPKFGERRCKSWALSERVRAIEAQHEALTSRAPITCIKKEQILHVI